MTSQSSTQQGSSTQQDSAVGTPRHRLDRPAAQLFSEFQKCLRNRDFIAARQLLAPDFVLTMPGTIRVGTGTAIDDVFVGWTNAFTDYGQEQGSITDITNVDGTQAHIRELHSMTHTGPFQLSDGSIVEPNPDRPIKVTICTFWDVLAGPNGIRKIDAVYDTLLLAHELRSEDTSHGRPTATSS